MRTESEIFVAVALDNPLQVGDTALSPIAHVHGGKQPHADEDVEWADVAVIGQRGLCRANHPFY